MELYYPNAVTTDGEQLFTYEPAHSLGKALIQFDIWSEHYQYDIEKAWIVRMENGDAVRMPVERKWRVKDDS